MKKHLSLLLAVLLVFTLAASVGGAARAQDKATTLTVGFAQEPDTLNGFYSAMAFGQWAHDLVNATLWDYDNNAQPVLVLASEIPSVANGTVSADLKTYTIKLKSGLMWSDGKPLTVDDVIFTMEMIADKANEFAQGTAVQGAFVKATKVSDTEMTVEWNAPQPFPEQLMSNVGGMLGILPKHAFEAEYTANKTLKNAAENQNPTVFSGPFVLKEWIRGESLTFEANPNYVNGAPKIKTLVIRIFPDPEAGYAAVAAGQVDYQPNLGQADPAKVKAMSPTNEVVTVFGGYIEYLYFNLRTAEDTGEGPAALKDVRVRQAIRLAVDRRAIVRDLLADSTTLTDSLYAGTQWENKDLGFVEADPAAAEKLLDEAGYAKGADGVRVNAAGERLEFRYSTTTAQWRKDIQQVIQQQLEKVGIKTILENYPASDFFGQFNNGGILATGNFHLGQFANNTVLTNIVNVTADESLGGDQVANPANPGGNNHGGFRNAEFDTLVEVTKTEVDAAKAQDAANKVQVILRDEVPLITLFPRGDIYVYNKDRFAAAPNIGSGVGNQWYDIINWELK
jgi:peptide/nickel transport system substrate-binding protein